MPGIRSSTIYGIIVSSAVNSNAMNSNVAVQPTGNISCNNTVDCTDTNSIGTVHPVAPMNTMKSAENNTLTALNSTVVAKSWLKSMTT